MMAAVTRADRAGRRGGFTLLELLVSMVILGVIVVVCGRIFEQSTVVWDSGTRKAELNLTGRAVVDAMAQEISHAVDDGRVLAQSTFDADYVTNLMWGASKIRFMTLEGDPSPPPGGSRCVRWVEYEQGTVGSTPVLKRRSWSLPQSRIYDDLAPAPRAAGSFGWRLETQPVDQDVAEHVTGLWFYPFYSRGGLPRFIDVVVTVARPEEISRGLASNYVYRTRAYLSNSTRLRLE